MTEISTNIF